MTERISLPYTLAAFVGATAAVLLACSSSSDLPAASGVSPSKLMQDLDDGEVTTFCKWSRDKLGGEGTVTNCPDGSKLLVTSQARCEEDIKGARTVTLSCALTVKDMEACTNEQSGDNGCERGPACKKVDQCLAPPK